MYINEKENNKKILLGITNAYSIIIHDVIVHRLLKKYRMKLT